jgi:hypothetical protein
MSNIFSAFLDGVFGADGYMKDFAHASRLYRDDNLYDLAPKAGWMYYIRLGLNNSIRKSLDPTWAQRYSDKVGLLAKKADLPNFKITTETVNQYNRKSVVQTKLNYNPISITFHDDMANSTTDLWRNYYKYYFADANVGLQSVGKGSKYAWAFEDNKNSSLGVYAYGLANSQKYKFFDSIEIFLLNKKKFLSFTLLNPIIREWQHGSVDQSSGNLLESKMTIDYEAVIYNKGNSARAVGFNENHYDKSPSPLSIAGAGTNTLFGPGGVIAGGAEIFGEVSNINQDTSALDLLKVGIQTANLAKNIGKLSSTGIKNEVSGAIAGGIVSLGRGSGFSDVASQLASGNTIIGGGPQTGSTVPWGAVANLFKSGATVDTVASAKNITGG